MYFLVVCSICPYFLLVWEELFACTWEVGMDGGGSRGGGGGDILW